MRRIRSLLVVPLVIALTLVASLFVAAPAQAADTASVSGTIIGPGPLGLSKVETMMLTLKNRDRNSTVDSFYLERGVHTFSFTGLAAGNYELEVDPEGDETRGGGYQRTAKEFALTTGHTTVDIVLTRGGYVSGKVTGGEGDIRVQLLHAYKEDGFDVLEPVGSSTVGPGGTYDIDIPFLGNFVVYASTPDNKYWAPRSAKTTFSENQRPTVDFSMRLSAQISGTVSFNRADLGTPKNQEDDDGNFVYVVVQREYAPAKWDTATYAAHLAAPGKFTLWVPGDDDARRRVAYYDRDDKFLDTYWDGTTYGTTSAANAKLFTTTPGSVYAGRDVTLRKSAPPTPPKPPKKAATMKIGAKPGKGKATVTVKVSASGIPASKVTGKVTISLKEKLLKTGSVKNGEAKVTITKQKKGQRTYSVKYLGNDKVKAATKSIKIKIK